MNEQSGITVSTTARWGRPSGRTLTEISSGGVSSANAYSRFTSSTSSSVVDSSRKSEEARARRRPANSRRGEA